MGRSPPRFFVASLATETNTFSPVFADLASFYESFYYSPGTHPAQPSLCSGPHIALRELAGRENLDLIEGTAAWADPAGMLQQKAYETLRDTIIAELEACLPVDAVLLGLHGAMVAQQCDDCEGELIAAVRERIGPQAVLGVSFDPHSHLSALRTSNADLIVAFKEYPHSDCLERARELTALAWRAVHGEIQPVMAVHDCRMIDLMPTTQEPMRSFVDKLCDLEQGDHRILDISVIHGFQAADVADLGAKIIVITDNDRALAVQTAAALGAELFAMRGHTRMQMLNADEALAAAAATPPTETSVIADVWDNPGGGTAGDDTRLLRLLVERGVTAAALAPFWDPQAVKFCFAAGVGATIPLRIGAKCGPGYGTPLDLRVQVELLVEQAKQTFGDVEVAMGRCAVLAIGGLRVVLTTNRAQAFGLDLFANMGIEPSSCRLLVVKSSNHFRAAFAKLSDRIYYCDSGTQAYPQDPRTTPYTKLKRKLWPLDMDLELDE